MKSLEFSNVTIVNSLRCSRNTVSKILKLSETHSLGWPIPDTLTNNDIEHLLYPDRDTNEGRRLSNYEHPMECKVKEAGLASRFRDLTGLLRRRVTAL